MAVCTTFARLRAAAGRGCATAHTPYLSTVRNIKSASSLAHGASTCAFDLLTGHSTRTVHRTVLVSGPLPSGGHSPPVPHISARSSSGFQRVSDTPSLSCSLTQRRHRVGALYMNVLIMDGLRPYAHYYPSILCNITRGLNSYRTLIYKYTIHINTYCIRRLFSNRMSLRCRRIHAGSVPDRRDRVRLLRLRVCRDALRLSFV